jgi:hypothetical protein
MASAKSPKASCTSRSLCSAPLGLLIAGAGRATDQSGSILSCHWRLEARHTQARPRPGFVAPQARGRCTALCQATAPLVPAPRWLYEPSDRQIGGASPVGPRGYVHVLHLF